MYAYIDANGLHLPTYQEILDDKKARYRAIFGADVYLEPDSQEGQMLAMDAQALYDAYQFAASVYNSFSPQTAQGAGLSRSVKINGITRQAASVSTVDLRITGQAGTVISGGIAQDVAGQKWRLPDVVTIPVAGEVIVTATAQDAGAVQAAAGEIDTIATPTRGWQAVTNPQAATPGTAAESDATLRGRQRVSTALPSQTVLEGLVGAVANVPGVTRFKGYENDTDVVDENGMPGHSETVVVEGGDTSAIAQAIALKKTPGVRTIGDTAVTVADKYGMPAIIRFYRPTDAPISVEVTIKARTGYVSPTGDTILANVVAYLNALEIGEDVLLSKLYSPINDAEPAPKRRTFEVVSLRISRDGQALAAANISIGFTELALGDAGTITIIVNEA